MAQAENSGPVDRVLIETLARELGELLLAKGWRVSTAESCTGGLIAAAITDIDGSSAWFEQSAICYANKAKASMLDVDEKLIENDGAVSSAVVVAMAQGALKRSGADIAVAVSGVAGPTGGSVDKPVGTVWLAWAIKERETQSQHFVFAGDRKTVRVAAVNAALNGCIQRLN